MKTCTLITFLCLITVCMGKFTVKFHEFFRLKLSSIIRTIKHPKKKKSVANNTRFNEKIRYNSRRFRLGDRNKSDFSEDSWSMAGR